MTDFFVTYTMANKEDRDGYLRETAHFAQLGELKKKYGVTADIQIEDR